MEPVGQDVDQEAADELGRGQTHDLLAIAVLDAVVLPSECDGVGIGADEAMVRDGHPMGISAQIGEHGLGAAEGWLGIHNPFGFAERGEPSGEGIRPHQVLQVAVKGQSSSLVQRQQPVKKEAPE